MRGAVRSGHLAKIPTRTLPTHTLEYEDDDEYENDVPHEWRPTGQPADCFQFTRWVVGSVTLANAKGHNVGRHFRGDFAVSEPRAKMP
jgi:hypothetical protein